MMFSSSQDRRGGGVAISSSMPDNVGVGDVCDTDREGGPKFKGARSTAGSAAEQAIVHSVNNPFPAPFEWSSEQCPMGMVIAISA